MATYEESGVNIELGDKCSQIAYQAAKNTFKGRQGMIAEPVTLEGGFSGALDMGDFYLVQNDDGIGTKMIIAEMIGKYDTMGDDLLAMVLDDAICLGAEPVSVTNTLDVDSVQEDKIRALMQGLEAAALRHKVVIPGGEIAELGEMSNGYIWNATCVGIVEKHKIITGEKVQKGDKLIALMSDGFRSNGFSLVRHILKEKYGEQWAHEKYDEENTWGQKVLTPSKIYSSAILEMHGRYGQESTVDLKGVVHITGGGLHGNIPRILKSSGLNYKIDNLPEAHAPMKKLMELGNVSEEEAYKTWNMGIGMVLISNEFEKIQALCGNHQIKTQIIGEIV